MNSLKKSAKYVSFHVFYMAVLELRGWGCIVILILVEGKLSTYYSSFLKVVAGWWLLLLLLFLCSLHIHRMDTDHTVPNIIAVWYKEAWENGCSVCASRTLSAWHTCFSWWWRMLWGCQGHLACCPLEMWSLLKTCQRLAAHYSHNLSVVWEPGGGGMRNSMYATIICLVEQRGTQPAL